MSLLARLARSWRINVAHYHVIRAARSKNLSLFTDSSRAFAAETSSESEDEGDTVHVTDACVQRLRELREEGSKSKGGGGGGSAKLRVRVDSGGCSGFQYSFTMDDATEEGDRTISKSDIQIVVDEVSFQFLKGATIDYTEELIKSAFEVTSNPNADSSCGCGNSFVLK
jgi:iron-sulfur cluster assembly accessory protein